MKRNGESIPDWSKRTYHRILPTDHEEAYEALRFDGPEDIETGSAGSSGDVDNPYTQKIVSPIYEPKGKKPSEAELFDRTYADGLIDAINAAEGMPDEVRAFLRHAAERHVKFRYDLIAEYYAHASADVQEHMEQSALVIIDFEKAIECGFVRLNADIDAAFRQDHPDA